MLAIFPKSVAEAPAQLTSQELAPANSVETAMRYEQSFPDAVSLKFSNGTRFLISHSKQSFSNPRQFANSDGIYCLFAGSLENFCQLRQAYGLPKSITEVQLVIEAYKVLRDRGPYSADQVVSDLKGNFTFVIYDSSSADVFASGDHVGKLPFYWGTNSDGALVITDSAEVVKAGCGKSFAPFPKGFFFSSELGLKSFTHPKKTPKAIPHVDSQGQLCGSTFRVDSNQDLVGKANEAGEHWMNSF